MCSVGPRPARRRIMLSILLDYPVLSGGTGGPGLQEDILIKFVDPQAGGPLTVQVLLGDMAGQFSVVNCEVATFAAGKAVMHSQL